MTLYPGSSPWVAVLGQQAALKDQARSRVHTLLFSAPGPFSTGAPSPPTNVVFDEADKDFGGTPAADLADWGPLDMDALLREVEMSLIKRCRGFDRGCGRAGSTWAAEELRLLERADVRLVQVVCRMAGFVGTCTFGAHLSTAILNFPLLAGQSAGRYTKETFRHVTCPVDEETGMGRRGLVGAYLRVVLRAVVAKTELPAMEMVIKIAASRPGSGELTDEYKAWLRSFATDEAIGAAQMEFLERRAKSQRLRRDKRVDPGSEELRYHFLNGVDRAGVVTLALIETIGSLKLPVAIKEALPEDLVKMGWSYDVRPDGSVRYWRRELKAARQGNMVREGVFKVTMDGKVLELLGANPREAALKPRH
ncbi:hypothetical protein OQA88_4598 [Cercophora sp. LCS_1]